MKLLLPLSRSIILLIRSRSIPAMPALSEADISSADASFAVAELLPVFDVAAVEVGQSSSCDAVELQSSSLYIL